MLLLRSWRFGLAGGGYKYSAPPELVLKRIQIMSFTFINPDSLGAPRGYSNGVLAESGGKLLFVAGQVAWDQRQQIISADLVEQFDRALANVVAVVTEAGGKPEQIARLVICVTDKNEYKMRMKEI